MKKINVCITDANGIRWFFDGEKIKRLELENEPDDGYECASLEDGLSILIQMGYDFPNVGIHPDEPEACPACGTLATELLHDPTCPLSTNLMPEQGEVTR